MSCYLRINPHRKNAPAAKQGPNRGDQPPVWNGDPSPCVTSCRDAGVPPQSVTYGSSFRTRLHGSAFDRFGQPSAGSYSPDLPRFCSPVPPGSLQFSGSPFRSQLLLPFSGRLLVFRVGLWPYPFQVSGGKDSKNPPLPTSTNQHLPKSTAITTSTTRRHAPRVTRLSYQRPRPACAG